MRQHIKNHRTLYEFAIAKDGETAFTIWMLERRPSLNKLHQSVVRNLDAIRKETQVHNIVWNGDGTITAGDYVGKMTGRTLLEARGYKES